MGTRHQFAAAACLGALFACGTKREAPPVAPPAPARFSIHEWGLFAVNAGAPDVAAAVTETAGNLHTGHAPSGTIGIGMGGFGTLGGKPVIYVHLDEGVERVAFDLELGLPLTKLVERFPVGASRDPRTGQTSAGWHGVVARRGACAHPTRAPHAQSLDCTGTRDHFCEAAEIGRYAGDRVSCLHIGESSSELLFYRAEALPTAPLPLRLVREGDAWKVVATEGARIEGPVFYIETERTGAPVHIRALTPASFGQPIRSVAESTITPSDVRAALTAEALRRGLSAGEADAFVDAWAPAYFDVCRRTGPEASGTPPVALSQVGRSLLYFAPPSAIDAMVPLRTNPPARETKRVFLVRFVDEASVLPPPAPMSALEALMASGIGENAGGSGYAAPSFRGNTSAYPSTRVELGRPTVRGALGQDVITRVVRRNIGQLRFCHEQALTTNPTLHGVVELTFSIDARGAVPVSTLSRSTLGHQPAERCMVAAVRRWAFPAPEDGAVVLVKLPMTFSVLSPSPTR